MQDKALYLATITLVIVCGLSLMVIYAILTHTDKIAIEKTKQEQIWVNGCLSLHVPSDQVSCLLLIKPGER